MAPKKMQTEEVSSENEVKVFQGENLSGKGENALEYDNSIDTCYSKGKLYANYGQRETLREMEKEKWGE